jgi:hypothetical protein
VQACNIAGYLAADVIKASMQSAIDSKNSSLFLFDSVAAISAAIGVAIPFFDLLVAGATILVNAVAAGTTSHYTDAIASTTLWSEVQCIIYNDIKAVGYVDSSSYTTIGTDLAAISYVHSDVVTAIAAYWVGLGLTAVQSAQAAGSLYVETAPRAEDTAPTARCSTAAMPISAHQ